MKNYKLLLAFVCIFIGMLILFVYTHAPAKHATNTINVVCTTSIIADTVRAIGGDYITVTCLMGPGIDPHVYRAREGDVHTLAAADIIFYHGLHLEGKMAHALEAMQRYTTSVAVTDTIPEHALIIPADSAQQHDPHIWFDASLWIPVAEHIGAALAMHDPSHADYYINHAAQYIRTLKELHTDIKQAMQAIPAHKRIIVTAHDAFSYFGKAYDCTVVGLQGISTESEAGIADITNLVTYMIDHEIPIVFAESSIPPKALEALCDAARARGWHIALGPTLYTDALGDESSPAKTYLDMMRYTRDVFAQALA